MRSTSNTAKNIAKALLCRAKNNEMALDHLKLQKLLYFAQALSLVRNNKPIFNDSIYAWDHGPVIESVYTAYKDSGRKKIVCDEKDTNTIKLSIEDIQVLDDVLETFKEYTGVQLRNMTHKHLPWKNIFEKDKNHVIKNKKIKEYYTQVLE